MNWWTLDLHSGKGAIFKYQTKTKANWSPENIRLYLLLKKRDKHNFIHYLDAEDGAVAVDTIIENLFFEGWTRVPQLHQPCCLSTPASSWDACCCKLFLLLDLPLQAFDPIMGWFTLVFCLILWIRLSALCAVSVSWATWLASFTIWACFRMLIQLFNPRVILLFATYAQLPNSQQKTQVLGMQCKLMPPICKLALPAYCTCSLQGILRSNSVQMLSNSEVIITH
jgi:hypothetical protein